MLTDAQLKALGLTREQIGPIAVIPPPSEDVGEGGIRELAVAGVVTISSLLNLPLEALRFVPLDVSPARDSHTHVERLDPAPHIVKLSLPEDKEFQVITERGRPEDAIRVDEEDPSTVWGDLKEGGTIRISFAGGEGLVVTLREDGSTALGHVVGSTIEIPPLAEPDSPLEEWCQGLEDPWLAQEIQDRLAVGDPWFHAAAMGMYLRFLSPTGREDSKPAVDALLQGEPDDFWKALDRVRTWARSLGADQVDTIVALSDAMLDALEMDLRELGQEMKGTGEPPKEAREKEIRWAQILHVFHRRDDLEGVQRLLEEARRGEELELRLEVVDNQGEALVERLRNGLGPAPLPLLEDERMRRVLQGDPDAWWARLAAEEPGTPG